MNEYLEHGKFKYIDKWKSKSGKWVYKYAEDVKKKASELNDKYGPKKTTKYIAGGTRPERNGGGSGVKGYTQKQVTVKRNLIGGKKVSRSEAYVNPSVRAGKEKNTTQWSKNTGKSLEARSQKFAGNNAVRYRWVDETISTVRKSIT